MHINPDHFLLTDNGRLWTPERSRQAWEQAYNQLERQLLNSEDPLRICLVMGVQGAGKSSWIRAQGDDSGILYFDAALPARHHRQRLIGIARQHDCPIEAVHIEVPLSIALERNRQRPEDEVVSETAIRSVFGLLEPPATDEGFIRVRRISNS